MRNLRILLLVTIGVLSLVIVAGCGGDDDTTSSGADTGAQTGGTETESSGGSDVLAESEAIVEEAKTGVGEFPGPDEPFDPGKKKAAVIDFGFDIPVIVLNGKIAVEAYKAMGWEVAPPYDGELNPATYGALIDKLTEEGVDAITLISTPLEPVKASVERAIDAGVAITDVNGGQPAEITDLGVVDATVNFEKQGELQGHYVIASTEGKGHAVLTLAPESPPVVSRVAGAEKILSKCTECEQEVLKMTAAETTEPGPPTWTAFLAKNPEGSGITNVVGFYDGITIPMATTLAQQGREDITLQGYDADEAAVEMINTESAPLKADIAIPYEYQTWSAVDLAGRIASGLKPWKADDMPFQLLTKENAGDYKPWFEPEGDWKAMFEEQWSGK